MDIKHSIWLTTNELQDCIKALQLTQSFIKKATEDSYYWKWVLVALHNSVQGFMVCALRGEDGTNVLKDRVADRIKHAKDNKTPQPKIEMDTFLNLYRKIQSDRMLSTPQSKKFVAKEAHDRSIRRLNRLRNHFVHFTPKSWATEISTFPLLCLQCLKVVRFLAFSSGNISLANEEQTVRSTLEDIELFLERMNCDH